MQYWRNIPFTNKTCRHTWMRSATGSDQVQTLCLFNAQAKWYPFEWGPLPQMRDVGKKHSFIWRSVSRASCRNVRTSTAASSFCCDLGRCCDGRTACLFHKLALAWCTHLHICAQNPLHTCCPQWMICQPMSFSPSWQAVGVAAVSLPATDLD